MFELLAKFQPKITSEELSPKKTNSMFKFLVSFTLEEIATGSPVAAYTFPGNFYKIIIFVIII